MAKILYDNNGKDVSIRLTIFDPDIIHEEIAIIDIIGGIPSYGLEASIDKTNIDFIQFNPDLRNNLNDNDLNHLNVIPVLLLTKSTIECYVNSTHSYLIKYTYKNFTIEQFMMRQAKAGKKRDIIVYTKTDEKFIEECEKNMLI
ncbi:hypothetical protein RF11_13065 [Thelohanellus kitauei]|uniref:Uncharacterized protein n=1 Tax=Thelohanellus kitauei TaxID=669202 RepID=A0A0C2IWW6_THEKT|nr:hypothetical protein RF11_13065 [Thelohanellus kitauei]